MIRPARTALRFSLTLAVVILLLPGARVSFAAPGARHSKATGMLAANGQVLTQDKGKFRDMVNGKQVGSEEFVIRPSGEDWVARGTAEVKSAKGPETHITSLLRLRADGVPLHYEWTTVTGPKKATASIDFNNGTATIHLQVNGSKTFTQQFFFKNPLVAILDDNLYHQYAILADLYDWSKKGRQTFSVLIPQEMTPGTITVEALEPEDANGKTLERLKVKSQDLEMTLYLDGNRLVRIAVPSANAEIVRE